MIRLSDNNYRDYRQRTTTTITTWGPILVEQNYTIITLYYSRRWHNEILHFFNSKNVFYKIKIVLKYCQKLFIYNIFENIFFFNLINIFNFIVNPILIHK